MSAGLLAYGTGAGVLGAGLVAGIFFAFSSFVMQGLGRIEAERGIAAMQSINVTVLNPWFFTAFFGTAAVSLALAVVAVVRWAEPGAGYLLAGGVLYLLGCIGVTVAFNVPLNEKLGAVAADSAAGAEVWQRYLPVWIRWNHVRTAASLAAAGAFLVAMR